jgi:hypothetical protein
MVFYKEHDYKILLGFGYAFDRTQTLSIDEDIIFIRDLGSYTNKNFEDICFSRATEIYNMSVLQDKQLCVLWSGGIDSTVVLISLLQLTPKVKVLLTKKSIQEYPEFYEKCVKNLDCTFIDSDFIDGVKKTLKNNVVVTGEIADQLFGTDKYFQCKDKLQDNWDTIVDKKFLYLLEPYVCKSPQKIKSVKDFLWWVNYTLKYQHVCFRIPIHINKAILDKNLLHFFDSQDWNDWAVSTPTEEKFFGTDFKNYKQIAKNYIYKYTKDQDYKLNKTKVPSLDIYGIKTPYKLITKDWVWE